MEFRIEEKGELVHFYPLTTDKWMVVKGRGEFQWKLYKATETGHSFIAEFLKLEDACEVGEGL